MLKYAISSRTVAERPQATHVGLRERGAARTRRIGGRPLLRAPVAGDRRHVARIGIRVLGLQRDEGLAKKISYASDNPQITIGSYACKISDQLGWVGYPFKCVP